MLSRGTLVVATVATILALGAMTAWAADGDGFGFDADQPDAAQRWQQTLERNDADKDGKLSKDEFQGGDAVFDRRDKNGDGFITQDEFTAPQGDGEGGNAGGDQGQRFRQFLQNADKNGDGKIDRDEWPGKDEGFDRLDKNGDGVIDEAEMPGGGQGGQGGRFGDMDPEQRWKALLDRFDLNNDGKISQDEFKGPDNIFKMLDRNGDGAITEDEGKAGGPPGGGQGQGGQGRDPAARFKNLLRQWDADDDGKLSKDEWKGREEMFARLDADGDTFVTEQEYADGMAQMMARRNPAQELLKLMDADADGRVSAEEWAAYFAEADGNGDGFLTQDEMMKAMRPPRPDQGPPPPPAGDMQ